MKLKATLVSIFNDGFVFCEQQKDKLKKIHFFFLQFVLAWGRTVTHILSH